MKHIYKIWVPTTMLSSSAVKILLNSEWNWWHISSYLLIPFTHGWFFMVMNASRHTVLNLDYKEDKELFSNYTGQFEKKYNKEWKQD